MNNLSLGLCPENNSKLIAIRLAGLLAVAGLLGGCVVEEVGRRPRAETVVVEEGPRPAVVTEEVVIRQAPPPLREEVILERERPSPRHMWVAGYWGWRAGGHVWIAGHWELPPRENVVWVAPRWEHRAQGYVFIAGSWRDGPAVVHERVSVSPGVNVGVNLHFVAQPPPPPRHEVIVEAQRPSREHIWINGYYVWRDGRHVWIAGHWERPPHAHAVWVEPRWERHPEGYVFIEGFWR